MSVVAIVLGGGQGRRLYPLTGYRSKPAVPIGGKYRLVDIPISNSLHSGIKKVFVLTQFNSVSLNNHIHNTYKFDYFSRSSVTLLTAEQTLTSERWFQGTADAVRCHLPHYHLDEEDDVFVLSGDQLYRMDYQELLKFHREKGADLTLSTITVPEKLTGQFGILKTKRGNQVVDFVEKPKTEEERRGFESNKKGSWIASMGVYVFKASILNKVLQGDEMDFGRELIPRAIRAFKAYSYPFGGYWRDIGTIKSLFEANMELVGPYPKFRFASPKGNIFTHPRFLPPAQILSAKIDDSLVSEGSVIRQSTIKNAIIGLRSVIQKGVKVKRSVVMGNDFYEFEARRKSNAPLGIGEGTIIENAILDKNVRIGKKVTIRNEKRVSEFDGPNYYIREGITIIPKGAVISDGTVI